MRQAVWFLIPSLLFIIGLSVWQSTAWSEDGSPPSPDSKDADDLFVAPAVEYKNLAIYPVVSRVGRHSDNYLTLDEGLLSGEVTVSEFGAVQPASANVRIQTTNVGGAVNRLVVVNKSTKPLYLMSGEVILGGKQDRSLAESLVIAPDAKPHEVPVFCVEHGRWHLRTAQETQNLAAAIHPTADREVVARLAEQASQGSLVISCAPLSKSARQKVNDGTDQGTVWNDVGSVNGRAGNASSSSAYTANFTQPEVQQSFAPYVDAMERAIANTENVVGVVVAINGRMEMADVFESTPMFRKLWPKLLKSYALDATTNNQEQGAKAATLDDARQFFAQSQTAELQKTQLREGAQVEVRAASNLSCFAVSPASGEAKPAAPAVHTAVFAK